MPPFSKMLEIDAPLFANSVSADIGTEQSRYALAISALVPIEVLNATYAILDRIQVELCRTGAAPARFCESEFPFDQPH